MDVPGAVVSTRRWERLAPAGGLGFLLSLVVGAVVLGTTPPSSQAPPEEIAAYFAEFRSGILFNSALAMLGTFTLLPWFVASLWRATRRAEGEQGIASAVVLLGGAGLMGTLLLQAAGWAAASLEAGSRRDASVAAGMMDLGNVGLLLLPMPAAVLIAATTLAARPGVLLPAWLARAGVPLAVLLVVFGIVQFIPQLPFTLFGLWVMVVSVVLLRSPVGAVDASPSSSAR